MSISITTAFGSLTYRSRMETPAITEIAVHLLGQPLGQGRGHSMLPGDSVGEDHESALELFGGTADPGVDDEGTNGAKS